MSISILGMVSEIRKQGTGTTRTVLQANKKPASQCEMQVFMMASCPIAFARIFSDLRDCYAHPCTVSG